MAAPVMTDSLETVLNQTYVPGELNRVAVDPRASEILDAEPPPDDEEELTEDEMNKLEEQCGPMPVPGMDEGETDPVDEVDEFIEACKTVRHAWEQAQKVKKGYQDAKAMVAWVIKATTCPLTGSSRGMGKRINVLAKSIQNMMVNRIDQPLANGMSKSAAYVRRAGASVKATVLRGAKIGKMTGKVGKLASIARSMKDGAGTLKTSLKATVGQCNKVYGKLLGPIGIAVEVAMFAMSLTRALQDGKDPLEAISLAVLEMIPGAMQAADAMEAWLGPLLNPDGHPSRIAGHQALVYQREYLDLYYKDPVEYEDELAARCTPSYPIPDNLEQVFRMTGGTPQVPLGKTLFAYLNALHQRTTQRLSGASISFPDVYSADPKAGKFSDLLNTVKMIGANTDDARAWPYGHLGAATGHYKELDGWLQQWTWQLEKDTQDGILAKDSSYIENLQETIEAKCDGLLKTVLIPNTVLRRGLPNTTEVSQYMPSVNEWQTALNALPLSSRLCWNYWIGALGIPLYAGNPSRLFTAAVPETGEELKVTFEAVQYALLNSPSGLYDTYELDVFPVVRVGKWCKVTPWKDDMSRRPITDPITGNQRSSVEDMKTLVSTISNIQVAPYYTQSSGINVFPFDTLIHGTREEIEAKERAQQAALEAERTAMAEKAKEDARLQAEENARIYAADRQHYLATLARDTTEPVPDARTPESNMNRLKWVYNWALARSNGDETSQQFISNVLAAFRGLGTGPVKGTIKLQSGQTISMRGPGSTDASGPTFDMTGGGGAGAGLSGSGLTTNSKFSKLQENRFNLSPRCTCTPTFGACPQHWKPKPRSCTVRSRKSKTPRHEL
jgi:hypothetical protein